MADERKEPGCGWTQQRIVDELIAQASKQYAAGLKRVGVLPAKRETLLDGYQDGMRAAIHHLEGMGVLVVLADRTTET